MEFSCPACNTPHAFPDDQVPTDGIVVACTHCSKHITLTGDGVVQPDAPQSAPPPIDDLEHPTSVGPAPTSTDLPLVPKPQSDPPGDSGERPGFFGKLGGAVEAAANAAGEAFDAAADEEMGAETEVPEGLHFPGANPSAGGDWTWRDLPRAFVGVFDKNRVLFATAGMWAALVSFGLVNWLGGWLGGLVGVLGTVMSVAAWIVAMGIGAFVASVMGFVCYQTVIEQRASSMKAGIAWSKRWLKSVIGTPIAFVVVIAALGGGEALVGLLGKIPFAGPIIWGAVSPAIVLLSLAAGGVAIALIYSLPLYIPVIINEKTGPKETLFRLLGLYKTQGFSLLGYVLLSIAMIGVAMYTIVVPALFVATGLTTYVATKVMGENLFGLVSKIPDGMSAFTKLILPLPGMGSDLGFGHTVGGILAGLGLTLAPALLLAVVLLTYYTAGGIIYNIVTKRPKK